MKNLYHIQFAIHNKYPAIHKAIHLALGSDDQWVAFDSHTYLVHTDKPYNDLRLLIGVRMANDIDDFMLMKLDYDTAMSTFTDRHDIIKLLRSISKESPQNYTTPSQDVIDALLDKVSLVGRKGLTKQELELLSRF